MKICFIILLTAIVVSCQSQIASRNAVYNGNLNTVNSNLIKNPEKIYNNQNISETTNLKCENNDFKLVVANENEHKIINIIKADTIKNTITLPNQNEVNGFSLNWAKKTKNGFEISVEYGSRYYYQKQFDFICKKNNFYLNKIKTESFDKQDPENSGKESDIKIRPNISVERFKITDYMND